MFFFSGMSSQRHFIRPRRRAAEVAIGLLFGDTSDEEPHNLDEEDMDFINDDNEHGVDETIIVPSNGDTVDVASDEEIVSPQAEFNEDWWDAMTPFVPPCSHFNDEHQQEVDNHETMYDIFLRVSQLERLIDDVIIPESERYSQQQGVSFQTNIEEIKAFLGMTILMGYHRLPSMRDYWSQEPDLTVPFVANCMTRRRFEIIRKMLHLADNNRENVTDDRAYKIRPLIRHFNEAFHTARKQSRSQTIDEHMVTYKGHNIMKQYVKNKPIRWGFKLWVRACARTGFVYEIDLYTGKKDGNNPDVGLGEAVVLQLTEKIADSGIIIAFDNFFTSTSVMEKLHDRQIRAVGTVRTNRKRLPPLKSDRGMKAGEVNGSVHTSGRITCCQWKDKRVVTLLSNFLSPFESTTEKRRQKGHHEREEINVPVMVKMYNFYMGGVDLADQLKECYEIDHRAKYKYYLRIFFDIIDTAVCNSFIVFKDIYSETNTTSKEFRQTIVCHLMSGFTSRSRSSLTPSRATKRRRLDVSPNITHLPVYTTERRRCCMCSNTVTNARSNIKCEACEKYLCLNATRNCFYDYHHL